MPGVLALANTASAVEAICNAPEVFYRWRVFYFLLQVFALTLPAVEAKEVRFKKKALIWVLLIEYGVELCFAAYDLKLNDLKKPDFFCEMNLAATVCAHLVGCRLVGFY
jgi:hypothetical protein